MLYVFKKNTTTLGCVITGKKLWFNLLVTYQIFLCVEIFNKNFSCSIRSVTQLWLIWISTIKNKSLNTKQCPAGLYSRITCFVSPFLPKMSKNCYIHQVWALPLPLNIYGQPWDGGKSYPTAKNLFFSLIWKIPLNRFRSFASKSFVSSPSNRNFFVFTLCNLHL